MIKNKICLKNLANETQMKLRSLRAAKQSGNSMLLYFSYYKEKKKLRHADPLWAALSRPLWIWSYILWSHRLTCQADGMRDHPLQCVILKYLCSRHFHSLHNLSTGVFYLLYTVCTVCCSPRDRRVGHNWATEQNWTVCTRHNANNFIYIISIPTTLRQMLIFLYPF